MMDASEIRSLFEELQSVDLDMDADYLNLIFKTCSIIETMTADHCRNIIRMAGSRPCLQIFMSDGWSTDLRSRVRSSGGGVLVQRTGRLRTEFVLQRTLVKALVGG